MWYCFLYIHNHTYIHLCVCAGTPYNLELCIVVALLGINITFLCSRHDIAEILRRLALNTNPSIYWVYDEH